MHQIVHLVRRFAPVGGMEIFVLELVKAQLSLGAEVIVVCNVADHSIASKNLRVVEFLARPTKPRWLEAWRFGRSCCAFLDTQINRESFVVHSHERTWSQDIVTFHGQVYAYGVSRKPSRYFSPRHRINLHLELKQVVASGSMIVPVSLTIKEQLLQQYGADTDRICEPIKPAVRNKTKTLRNETLTDVFRKSIIGFSGKEWKRKGLPFALEIFKQYLMQYGNAELWISGSKNNDLLRAIPRDLRQHVRVLSWRENLSDFYEDIDLLLHPAQSEPYGMVVIEALSHRVPVVVSDQVGASMDITEGCGYVVSLNRGAATWASAVRLAIKRGFRGEYRHNSWRDMALQYMGEYQKAMLQKRT